MTDKKGVQGFHNSFGFGPSDRPEQLALPLRLVCVAEFLGSAGNSPGETVPIDAHDFDAVMAKLRPRFFADVPAHLGAGRTLAADLVLASIKDFEPRRIAERMPQLAPLRQFLDLVRQLSSGALSPAAFKQDLAGYSQVPALGPILDDVLDRIGGALPAGPQPSAVADDAVDSAIASIFSMVDSGRPAPAHGAIDAAASAVAGGARFDLNVPLARAESLLHSQLSEIVHHPGFRALEAAWRGLHLLCRNGKGARIELLPAARADVVEALRARLVEPDRQGRAAPVSLVLCDLPLANTPADVTLLQELGEIGSELSAPVVFALDAGFLGVESLGALAGMHHPAALLDGPGFDQWRSLRGKDAARWLVATLNGFAARQPYTGARHGFAEPTNSADHVLWASPVWLVGAAVARSQEQTGWPCSHSGIVDGELPGLPVFEVAGRDSQYPLQAIFPEQHIKELARAGLAPWLAQANHDSAWLVLAPVLHKPSRAEEEGRMHTLAWALLAARLGAAVGAAKPRLVVVNDAPRTVANFEQYLDGLLAGTGAGAGAEVRIADGAIQLSLRVGRALLQGVELQFSLPL